MFSEENNWLLYLLFTSKYYSVEENGERINDMRKKLIYKSRNEINNIRHEVLKN